MSEHPQRFRRDLGLVHETRIWNPTGIDYIASTIAGGRPTTFVAWPRAPAFSISGTPKTATPATSRGSKMLSKAREETQPTTSRPNEPGTFAPRDRNMVTPIRAPVFFEVPQLTLGCVNGCAQ